MVKARSPQTNFAKQPWRFWKVPYRFIPGGLNSSVGDLVGGNAASPLVPKDGRVWILNRVVVSNPDGVAHGVTVTVEDLPGSQIRGILVPNVNVAAGSTTSWPNSRTAVAGRPLIIHGPQENLQGLFIVIEWEAMPAPAAADGWIEYWEAQVDIANIPIELITGGGFTEVPGETRG